MINGADLKHCWRVCAAGICYCLFAIGGLLPGIYIFSLFLVPLSKAEKQRRVRKIIQNLCRFYVNLMEFMGLIDYHLQDETGKEFSTRTPFSVEGHMVISNHTMLIDALFALAYVDNLCCVVKSSLVYNPFTSIPVKLAGYIANNDERLVQRASEKLKSGENILIFPEGTRNEYDLQLDFKRGASNIAVFSQAPILPIVLCCMPRALCKGDKWYRIPRKKSIVVMQFHPVLELARCIDIREPRTRQYRLLTKWLRAYYLSAVSKVVDAA